MPSGYLHRLCALRACAAAGLSPQPEALLVLGAQGPDPLFMLGMFPLGLQSRPSPLGGLLHHSRTGAFLLALLAAARERGDLERAYAMGFLTHYALDATVHPYVYAHSRDGDDEYSSLLHMRLEKRWDALFFRREGGRGTPLLMPGVTEAKPFWDRAASLLADAIEKTYPEQAVGKSAVMGAFADAERANRLTHSPMGIKYGLVWVLERLLGKPLLATAQMIPRFLPRADIENAAKQPWEAPAHPGVLRRESLAELLDAAEERASELLLAAQAYYDGAITAPALADVVGNLGYDTGTTLPE